MTELVSSPTLHPSAPTLVKHSQVLYKIREAVGRPTMQIESFRISYKVHIHGTLKQSLVCKVGLLSR